MALTSCLRHSSLTYTRAANHWNTRPFCSLLLDDAVSFSQRCIRQRIPRIPRDTPHVSNYTLHSRCMSTTYPRLTPTYIIHTCAAACPDAVLGATTPPAPPCRSEDYIDRRISSALFAPSFPALSLQECGSAIPRLRIDWESLGRGELVSSLVVKKKPSSSSSPVTSRK
jgi:hypothetical protein